MIQLTTARREIGKRSKEERGRMMDERKFWTLVGVWRGIVCVCVCRLVELESRGKGVGAGVRDTGW